MTTASGALLAWYARFGRTHLPWRRTRDPYAIVVAEFMLQQTQVDRVLPLYAAFVERFGTFEALAASDAGDVMRAWRGLGYNSRAQRLRLLAQTVVREHRGALPRERDALLALPGIGPYTAAAVRAFAFDEDDVALDTNIRRVVHRLRFGLEFPARASERAVDAAATALVPAGRGHDWNSAMMDLGATICTSRAPKCLLCPLAKDCAAAPIDAPRLAELAKTAARRSPQEALPFVRTTRFLRGRIIDRLRDLPAAAGLTLDELQVDLRAAVPADRLAEIPALVRALVSEGLVVLDERGVRLR
ncbi:MAG: A/G-specific adenine glycosylase [Candidatus Velthaea sp.]